MIEVDIRVRRRDFTLEVAFTVEAPVTGVFGPSGAGKSTLVHAIAGLLRPDRGRIVAGGQVLFDAAARVHVPTHRRSVGVVFQEHRLFPHRSVRGNLLYGARGAPGRARLDAVVDLLELRPLLERRVTELSGGEGQRVAIGRALLARPRVLLLDEPFAALDRRLRQRIMPDLHRIPAELGVPVIHVSHDLEDLRRTADTALVLDRGRVAGCGPWDDVAHEPGVRAVVDDRSWVSVLRLPRAPNEPQEVGVPGEMRLQAAGAGPALVVPSSEGEAEPAAGDVVTVAIRPDDVAIAAGPVDHVSIRNQLPATVRRCTEHCGRVLVDLDLGGGHTLLAAISGPSRDRLGLAPGRPVVALVKTRAVRILGTR